MKSSCLWLIQILSGLALSIVATAGLASELTPHRALYDLSLKTARSGSGISAVTGKMAVEWNNSCSGWAFQYRSVIDVIFDEGAPVQLTSNAATWESSDNKRYRFDVRHHTNGKEVERIEGVATLGKDKAAGQTVFTHPKPLKIGLPAGTLFPVAHSLEIMRAAKSGTSPQFLSRTIFDGMDVDGLYQVNAIIGPTKNQKAKTPNPLKILKGIPSWSVSLAYFAVKSGKPAPSHEISMHLFANGVSDNLIMDFDEFVVQARLGQAELLPDPTCP